MVTKRDNYNVDEELETTKWKKCKCGRDMEHWKRICIKCYLIEKQMNKNTKTKKCKCGRDMESWKPICSRCWAIKMQQLEFEQKHQKRISMARGIKAVNIFNPRRQIKNNNLFYDRKDEIYLYKGKTRCDLCGTKIIDNLYFNDVWNKKDCFIKTFCVGCSQEAGKTKAGVVESLKTAVILDVIPKLQNIHPVFVAEPETTGRTNSDGSSMTVFDAALPKNTERGVQIIDHTKWASFDHDKPKLLPEDHPDTLPYKPYQMDSEMWLKDGKKGEKLTYENEGFAKRNNPLCQREVDNVLKDMEKWKPIERECNVKYVKHKETKQIEEKPKTIMINGVNYGLGEKGEVIVVKEKDDIKPIDSETLTMEEVYQDDIQKLKRLKEEQVEMLQNDRKTKDN